MNTEIPHQVEDTTQIALINQNVQYMQRDLAEMKQNNTSNYNDIKQSIKDLSLIYATQMAVEEIKKDISSLRGSTNFWKWFSPTLSAILSSVITFLVINYFQMVHQVR